jgi:DNA replicative helicase MCM subunit Mcm2 (Cdc46/Mcm family)
VENNVSGKLAFLPGHSKFICYQELKIQETPDQLDQGKIPKNFVVQVRGHLVKQATPGDIVKIQGVLLAHRRSGRFENDLAFLTHLVACKITREKKKYVEMNINAERIAEIQSMRANYTED